MSVLVWAASSDSGILPNIGGILQGLAEFLAIVGAGVGFLVRARRNAKRERLRTETAAALAAQQAKKALEERVEKQQNAQVEDLKRQNRDLQATNAQLLDRLLGESHE